MSCTKESLLAEIESDPLAAVKAHRSVRDIQPQTLRELASGQTSEKVLLFLASYPDVPSRLLEKLFTPETSIKVLCALAENSRTPTSVLLQLAKHENVAVRKTIAASRDISMSCSMQLSGDSSPEVRCLLAKNAAISPSIQVILREDEAPFVRSSLLDNARLDEEVRRELAEDSDPTVQAMALAARKMDEKTLLEWAQSGEHFSQAILLTRPQLPDKVLEALCFSTHADIQKAAVDRKRLTNDEMLGFARQGDEELRLKIAACPDLPELVQTILAQDASPRVRCALASSPTLAVAGANALIQDEDAEVRAALITNLATPLTTLLQLAESGDNTVLKNLASRPCPQDVMDLLYRRGDDDVFYHLAYRGAIPHGMPASLQKRLTEHSLPSLRALAASADDLPIFLLAQLARDIAPMVRLAVARNSITPISLLELLAADTDRKVRSKAEEMLARHRAGQPAPPLFQDTPTNGQPLSETNEESTSGAEAQDEEEEGEPPSLFQRFFKQVVGPDEEG